MHRLAGYRNMGPVMLGSGESEHIEHDVYGVMVMSLAQIFFDRRLQLKGDIHLYERLQGLAFKALDVYQTPSDSGLSEGREIRTNAAAMTWGACNRLANIAEKLELHDQAKVWHAEANKVKEVIMTRCWNEQLQSFVSTFDGKEVDFLLLTLHFIGLIEAKHPRFLSTLKRIEERLLVKGAYLLPVEGYGAASNSATTMYIHALAETGQEDRARAIFNNLLATANSHGILSENVLPDNGELWGNYPHNLAIAGVILCATRLSKSWRQAF